MKARSSWACLRRTLINLEDNGNSAIKYVDMKLYHFVKKKRVDKTGHGKVPHDAYYFESYTLEYDKVYHRKVVYSKSFDLFIKGTLSRRFCSVLIKATQIL